MVIFYLASAFGLHCGYTSFHFTLLKPPLSLLSSSQVVQHVPLNSVYLCTCSVFDSRGVSMARNFFIFLCVLLLHVQSLGTCAETRGIFIVLMDTALMPRAFISPHQWYKNTLSLVLETSEALEMLYTYTAIGGFSAVLTSSQHKKIKNSHDYITSLTDKRRAKFLTTHSSDLLGLNYVHGASYFGYESGTTRGVVPRAHVAMYKIGTGMFISDSDILAGIDQAIEDGVDILSLSFCPLEMGAGHVNPNNAMDPGLVYDAGEEEYINYLCAANFTWTQVCAIVRSNFTCATPAVGLNYPSFLVDLDCSGTESMLYHRTVTNVGEGRSSYSVRFEH